MPYYRNFPEEMSHPISVLLLSHETLVWFYEQSKRHSFTSQVSL